MVAEVKEKRKNALEIGGRYLHGKGYKPDR
jgi:hypothetical protein